MSKETWYTLGAVVIGLLLWEVVIRPMFAPVFAKVTAKVPSIGAGK